MSSRAFAGKVADSISDFALVQGSNGWRYGYIAGAGGAEPTSVLGFREFDLTTTGVWKASAAEVGADNNVFLSLTADGGHPNGLGPGAQDTIIWATRRFTTPRASLSVVYEFFCAATIPYPPNSAGATGRVFVNGSQRALHPSRNFDDKPRAAPMLISDTASMVDFASDPHGVAPFTENEWSARSDTFVFHARFYDYPCASSADCGDIACINSFCCDRALHDCGDAGVAADAGFDAGMSVIDAGIPDAGMPDAGPVLTVDAGTRDAGAGATSPRDAGPLIDAGQTVDGGTPEPSARADIGCTCASGAGEVPLALLLLGLFPRRARYAAEANPSRGRGSLRQRVKAAVKALRSSQTARRAPRSCTGRTGPSSNRPTH